MNDAQEKQMGNDDTIKWWLTEAGWPEPPQHDSYADCN